MANKKLLYNENGTSAEIANSGSLPSVYFDNTTNTLIAQGLVINKVTASIGSISGILGTDANGKLITISTASATSGQYLQSNGTNWAFRSATGVATGDYLPGSDLSGSLSAPTVISIRNVVSGTLSALYGGTGVSSFTSGGLLIKNSTSTMKFVIPDAGASVLRPDGSGSWYSGGATGTASYGVQVTYLTCSTPYTTYTTTWTKPTGHKNVRVILMGGGGGGGATSLVAASAGAGGGGGGLSVYDFFESNNTTATVTIGAGGGGGSAFSPNTAATGSAGGNTIFSSSVPAGFYFTALGGAGASTGAAFVNGPGNIVSGSGAGGAGGANNTGGQAGFPGGGSLLINEISAAGGTAGTAGGGVGGAGGAGGAGGSIATAFGLLNYNAYIGGGGGGGGGKSVAARHGGDGGNGIYGSGGGGGGNTGLLTAPTTKGGNGGDGYAIIASW